MKQRAPQRDQPTVFSLLTSDRNYRITQLAKDLDLDLSTTEARVDDARLESLFRAVDALHRRLSALFTTRQ
jgi:hypothetical protein